MRASDRTIRHLTVRTENSILDWNSVAERFDLQERRVGKAIYDIRYFNAREERRRYFKTDAPEFRPGESYFGGGRGGGARFRPEESWGKLIAMTPETGEIKWEHRILAPPWAGALSTAGNLVFSATPSGIFYALDARTGKELWHFNGGDRVFASPITFLSRGKQLVTIPIGDILIAFGLD